MLNRKLSKFLVTSTLLIQAFSFAASAQDAPLSPDKEMTMEFYRVVLKEKECRESLRNYLGCAVSIQTLLQNADEHLSLETSASMNRSIGKIVYDGGPLKIVLNESVIKEELPKTRKEAFEKIQKKNSELKAKFQDAFNSQMHTTEGSIDGLTAYIEKQYSKKLTKPMVADALNEYTHISSDPHSDFRFIESLEKGKKEAQKEYAGIGVEVSSSDHGLLVSNVFQGSGAEDAKIQGDDIIFNVDGKDVAGLSIERISKMLMGTPGTNVHVSIKRDSQTLKLTVTRKKIIRKIVSSQLLELFNKKIGYIKYSNFEYEKGCEEIKTALESFNSQNSDGAILDLRENGGGSVEIAQCIAGLFLGPMKVLVRFEKNVAPGKTVVDTVYTMEEKVYEKPLVILINAYSASASELISGSFKERNRALIVGQTSFGKGSAQGPVVETKSFQFWGTIGLFFLPSGKTNQTIGVKPHLEVHKGLTSSDLEDYPMREKDRFMFPIEPHLDQIQVSKECVDAQEPRKVFEQTTKGTIKKDMQLLTGAAAIGCFK
jgi:carboxyl-terminal processing protease